MRAVIYTRVSSDVQVDKTSLDTQDAECRAWCEREGYAVDKLFREEGASAKSQQRPVLLAMLAYCRKHQSHIDCVVVYKLDRFARNQVDHHSIRAMLAAFGIRLASATETLTDDPAGRLLEGMLAAFAQFDNEVRSERCRTGMAAAAERGAWVWKAPIGYLTTKTPEGDASLKPDPERAPLIRGIFERVAAGNSQRAALEWATSQGLRARSGRTLLQPELHRMLHSPVYAGRLVSPLLTKPVVGNWPAIVPPETWLAVQDRFANGTHPTRHTSDRPEFPLRRFTRCHKCGRGLTASWSKGRSKRYGYYHCRDCRDVRVRRETLEEQFLELVGTVRLDPDYAALWRETVRRTIGDVWRDRVDETRAAETRLASLERKAERLLTLYVDEELDKATYRARARPVLADLADARLAMENGRDAKHDAEAIIHAALDVYSNPAESWKTASLGGKLALQAFLFPEGIVYTGEGVRTDVITCIAMPCDAIASENRLGTPTGIRTRISSSGG
ncbi:MAG: recombinase family protein [Planctomycetota bacterium]